MADIKEKIIEEVEKIPVDKVSELYDIIHFFRIGIESQDELIEDKRKAILKFFGIWKDMSPEERAVLNEISLRRQIN